MYVIRQETFANGERLSSAIEGDPRQRGLGVVVYPTLADAQRHVDGWAWALPADRVRRTGGGRVAVLLTDEDGDYVRTVTVERYGR